MSDIQSTDRLSRFLRYSRQWKNGRIHKSAFEPPKGKHVLSVTWTQNMSDEAVWRWADTYWNKEHPARARADFTVKSVREAKDQLSVVIDNDPPRHAEIRGFPSDTAAIMQCAQWLAAACSLCVRHPEDNPR